MRQHGRVVTRGDLIETLRQQAMHRGLPRHVRLARRSSARQAQSRVCHGARSYSEKLPLETSAAPVQAAPSRCRDVRLPAMVLASSSTRATCRVMPLQLGLSTCSGQVL